MASACPLGRSVNDPAEWKACKKAFSGNFLSFLLSQKMEPACLWPYLGTSPRANPPAVRRNLPWLWSAESKLREMRAKDLQDQGVSLHGGICGMLPYGSEEDMCYIHTHTYACIHSLWKCLKTVAIILEEGSGDWGSRGWKGKRLFSACYFLPFVFCVYSKNIDKQINKPDLPPGTPEISGWAALPAALACGRQEDLMQHSWVHWP